MFIYWNLGLCLLLQDIYFKTSGYFRTSTSGHLLQDIWILQDIYFKTSTYFWVRGMEVWEINRLDQEGDRGWLWGGQQH